MGPLLNEGLKGAAPNSFCRPLISHMNHQLCTMTQLSIVISKLTQTSHDAMKGEAIE
jgi:hypothetical protein